MYSRFTLFFLCISSVIFGETYHLKQKDFNEGTYIISKPGTYILDEDISFNPNSPKKLGTDAYSASFLLPNQLKSQGGKYDDASYGIGFFATVAINANGVVFNLNNHTIEQSKEHALLQRFFAVIELADQPFIPGEGPHDFGIHFQPGKNIVIKNGTIGRSAHHGIHGNSNHNIKIENVQFKDFEVAAVALNGVKNLLIENCKATSRTDVPILATFSATRFLKPYLDYLVKSHSKTTLTIGGWNKLTASKAQDRVKEAINAVYEDLIVKGQNFIDSKVHPEEYALYHNKEHVIDGNCYGFLINSYGQAVEGFPTHNKIEETELAENIRFNNVKVEGLRGKDKETAYKVIYEKRGGRWLLVQVREVDIVTPPTHYENLKALKWLIGKWVDEDKDVKIETEYSWDRHKNFLTQTFKVTVEGSLQLEGRQVIAWDPIKGQIRSWVFDSDGGFGEGVWKKKGNSWVVEISQTLADGRQASAVNIYTPIDKSSYKWKSTGREVGGELLPDIEPVIVRKKG